MLPICRISWIVAFVVIGSPGAPTNEPNLAALVAQARNQHEARVKEVRSVRKYELRNGRWDSNPTLYVTMITSFGGRKRYEIQGSEAQGLSGKIFRRVLDGEVEAASTSAEEGMVNSINYDLRPIPGDAAPAQPCQSVELIPKKRSKYTLDGRGCVDMKDMAMVRMEGRTAKRVSFLIGKPYVVHAFRKVGDSWYSSSSHSKADVMFLGETDLFIEYLGYEITAK